MQIFIPSSKRPHKQTTYDNLPEMVRKHVKIVIPWSERNTYPSHLPKVVTPPEIKGIGATRQWICDAAKDRLLMLDDDLVFAVRRDDDPTKFRDATDDELIDLFLVHLDEQFEGYAHGAIAAREGANRNIDPYVHNVRCLRALFYDANILRKLNIKFTDMEVMEDFHVALSLLRAGYPSLSINYIVQNQNGSNLPGGCSEYRTQEVQKRAAFALQMRHPEFVTVVQKETKTAWGGGVRTDVRVAWKSAYASSANSLDNREGADSFEEGNGSAETMDDGRGVQKDLFL